MNRSVSQKGGVGIPVVLALIGGAVVLYIGYSLIGKLGSQSIPDQPINTTPVSQSTRSSEPSHAQAYVSFDDNFYESGSDFYIRIGGGLDENGKVTYTYIKADIADAKTFHKVPVLGGADSNIKGKSTGGGGSVPAFYMDSVHVYFFTGTSIEVLTGADPSSFEVLSPTYAKDNNSVYVVHTTCDDQGNCTGTVTVIPGADPGTFQTFHDTPVPDPKTGKTQTIDAKDDANIYYYGTGIGPLPDPDDHSLHPETDHPVLISP